MADVFFQPGSQHEALVADIKQRARNLFLTRQLLCAEAVVLTLNQGLKGGLSDTQAVALAAPFCIALGESGCICGALSGAVMASGLHLGAGLPYARRREMRDNARQLHDTFKAAHGATCCRVLSRNVQHDKTAHFQQCAVFTEQAAEMAARLILHKRPELSLRPDNKFLLRNDSKVSGAMARLFRVFSNRSKGV